MSNIDNTWFAGRLKFGMQFVEDRPLEMMSLLCVVPTDETPLATTQFLVDASHPDPITITSAPTKEAPEFCNAIPTGFAPPTPGPGLAVTPGTLTYDLPETGNRTVTYEMQRVGGTTGTLTVPFTVTEGTALEGTAGTDHFRLANGNIVFADGSNTQLLTIVLHPIARNDGDPAFVSATINWTNSAVIVTGGFTATTLSLKLYEAYVEPAE
jgi:hypothetical protein